MPYCTAYFRNVLQYTEIVPELLDGRLWQQWNTGTSRNSFGLFLHRRNVVLCADPCSITVLQPKVDAPPSLTRDKCMIIQMRRSAS